MAEYRFIRCESCNHFIAKVRILEAEPTPNPPPLNRKLIFEIFLYCKNRGCALVKDKKKNGENIVDIKMQ